MPPWGSRSTSSPTGCGATTSRAPTTPSLRCAARSPSATRRGAGLDMDAEIAAAKPGAEEVCMNPRSGALCVGLLSPRRAPLTAEGTARIAANRGTAQWYTAHPGGTRAAVHQDPPRHAGRGDPRLPPGPELGAAPSGRGSPDAERRGPPERRSRQPSGGPGPGLAAGEDRLATDPVDRDRVAPVHRGSAAAEEGVGPRRHRGRRRPACVGLRDPRRAPCVDLRPPRADPDRRHRVDRGCCSSP